VGGRAIANGQRSRRDDGRLATPRGLGLYRRAGREPCASARRLAPGTSSARLSIETGGCCRPGEPDRQRRGRPLWLVSASSPVIPATPRWRVAAWTTARSASVACGDRQPGPAGHPSGQFGARSGRVSSAIVQSGSRRAGSPGLSAARRYVSVPDRPAGDSRTPVYVLMLGLGALRHCRNNKRGRAIQVLLVAWSFIGWRC